MTCILRLNCCFWLILICAALPQLAVAQAENQATLQNSIRLCLPTGWREATAQEYEQLPEPPSTCAIVYDSAQGQPQALILIKSSFYPPALYQVAMQDPKEVAQALDSDTIRLVSKNNPVAKYESNYVIKQKIYMHNIRIWFAPLSDAPPGSLGHFIMNTALLSPKNNLLISLSCSQALQAELASQCVEVISSIIVLNDLGYTE